MNIKHRGEKIKDDAVCRNHGRRIFINSKAKCREDAVEFRNEDLGG